MASAALVSSEPSFEDFAAARRVEAQVLLAADFGDPELGAAILGATFLRGVVTDRLVLTKAHREQALFLHALGDRGILHGQRALPRERLVGVRGADVVGVTFDAEFGD